MKKFLLVLVLILLVNSSALALTNNDSCGTVVQNIQSSDIVVVKNEDNLFGLETKNGEQIVKPQYKKLIRLGKSSWIVQKKNKFGLIDNCGNYIVQPKYSHTERVLGRYAKFGNDNNYGLYDETGRMILPHEYSRIDILFGGMFLTCKNYKYGVVDMEGNTIIANKFDDIYMPKPNVMRIKFLGEWFEIEHTGAEELALPDNLAELENSKEFTISTIITDTGVISGYSVLTFTDYLIKIFSTISPAHEDTIDELMLSQGADTVSIFMQLGWIPKYPITYVKKYYYNFRNPNNGPLSDVRNELKQKL